MRLPKHFAVPDALHTAGLRKVYDALEGDLPVRIVANFDTAVVIPSGHVVRPGELLRGCEFSVLTGDVFVRGA